MCYKFDMKMEMYIQQFHNNKQLHLTGKTNIWCTKEAMAILAKDHFGSKYLKLKQ